MEKIYAIKSHANIKGLEDNIAITKSYIFSEDKTRLHYVLVKNTKQQPNATIALIPGTYETINAYIGLMKILANKGIECHGIDLRGCGLSGGNKYSLDLIKMQEDILALFEKAKSNNMVIIAHSISCIPLLTILVNNLHARFAGLILISPFLHQSIGSFSVLIPIYRFFKMQITQRIYNATKPVGIYSIELDPTNISHDSNIIEELIINQRNVKFTHNVLQWCYRILKRIRFLSTPLLILQGSNDAIGDSEEQDSFIKEYGCSDKNIHSFNGAQHSLINDTKLEDLADVIMEWVDLRADSAVDVSNLLICPPKYNIPFRTIFWWLMLVSYVFGTIISKYMLANIGILKSLFWLPAWALHKLKGK